MKHNNLAPVHQLGLNLWRDNVIRRPQIQVRLLAITLDNIHRERSGEIIDRALMRAITQVCCHHIFRTVEQFETALELAKASFHAAAFYMKLPEPVPAIFPESSASL